MKQGEIEVLQDQGDFGGSFGSSESNEEQKSQVARKSENANR